MKVSPLTTDEKNMVAEALFIAATSYRRQADDLRNFKNTAPGIPEDVKVPVLPNDPTSKAHTFKAVPVGWVFVKRMKYEDCEDTYIREVWVETRIKAD